MDGIDAMSKCQDIGSCPMMVDLKKTKHPSIFQIHLNASKSKQLRK